MNKYLKLFISLSLPLLAGLIGSYFTVDAINTWYLTLNKPFINPPNWIFGPVWTTLYILMGMSLYLVWITKSNKKVKGMKLFFIQLLLNSLWSILFFGLQSPLLAFLEIILLWIIIFITLQSFWEINKTAGLLLIPYLVWVSFAAILNFYIILLN